MPDRSFNEIRQIISGALPKPSATDGYVYIDDCGSDWVVYYDSGKLKKCSYSIDDSGKATFGEVSEVVERRIFEPAAMSVFSADESITTWQGMIFQAGDYPDKGTSFTEDDLDYMIDQFEPQCISLSHLLFDDENPIKTVFDEKLGWLKRIWRKGKDLFGEATVPTWLNEALKPEDRKVSVEIKSGALTGISLVPNPRVEGAALKAAYAAFCASHTVSAISADKSADTSATNGGKTRMTFLDKLTAKFKSGQIPKETEDALDAVLEGGVTDPPKTDPTISAEVAAMKSENEALKTAMAAQEAARLNDKAQAFADNLLTNEKIVPAQLESVVSMYKSAVKADSQGKSCFGTDGRVVEGDSVKALTELFEKATAHGLLTHKVQIAMSDKDESTSMSAEKRKQLLEASPEGRAALADEKKGGK